MPIIKSAKKRVRVAKKATIRNSKTKRSVRNAWKLFSRTSTAKNHSAAQSELGKAGKKHVMHKNKVARKQAQLAKAAKAAGVKPAKATKTATKTAAKPAVKKPVAKKPAVKKTTTKTAAKKPAAKKK